MSFNWSGDRLVLSTAETCRLFPFHVAFDGGQVIGRVGESMSACCPDVEAGRRLEACFLPEGGQWVDLSGSR